MSKNMRLIVIISLMALVLSLSFTPSYAQIVSVQKNVITQGGEMRVNEGEIFTITIVASSIGSRFWAVTDSVPAGFQIDEASFGASGTSRTFFDFDSTNVVFVAESSNINQTSRATVSYKVLANIGGTYNLPGAVGWVFDPREGFIPQARSNAIKGFQVISKAQIEIIQATRRLDSLDAKLSRAIAENSQSIDKLANEVKIIGGKLTPLREQLDNLSSSLTKLEADTASRFQDVQSSITMLETTQRDLAQSLRTEVNNVRSELSQQVSQFGVVAIVVAAAAAAGAWLQVARSRQKPQKA